MRRCPECATEYSDASTFCGKDGRVLIEVDSSATRLCPQCGNTVPAESNECRYCSAVLTPQSVETWSAARGDRGLQAPLGLSRQAPRHSQWVWVAGVLFAALTGYFAGGYLQRSDLLQSMQDLVRDLQDKEKQITVLKSEVAQMREDAGLSAKRVAELTGKFEQNQQDLTTAEKKSNGRGEKIATPKVPSVEKTVARPTDLAAGSPKSSRSADQVPLASSARAVDPGSYETVRYTTVHEEPANSSRVVSQIEKGTRITVVRAAGDWLEVRSKHGNPPGFIRRDDAVLVSRVNQEALSAER